MTEANGSLGEHEVMSARRASIYRKAARLSAYRDIQNMMGRACASLNFGDKPTLLSHFALDREDVSVSYADEGEFIGRRAVAACLDLVIPDEATPGYLLDMQLTTPMIEVAQDAQTAKCVWWCCGIGALPREGTDPQPIWLWGELSCDALSTSDGWKIWHASYFRLVKCDYHQGWVEDTSMANRLNTALSREASPVLYHNPYTPLSIRDGIPCAPQPYETWTPNDLHWELDRGKE